MKHSDLRIGVALSSGGAAGLAHIGVLEELERARIDINCVAGTSAGAMVAAAYAADQLPTFRDYMLSVTRRHLVQLFDPVWPRAGLMRGSRAMELIRPYMGERIEDLPRRFAAVATDLVSGRAVVISTGDVIEAIRASVAIPGLFTPQQRGDALLVDGALVDPVPVTATREIGADFVIAVNVISSLASVPSEAPPGPQIGMLARSLDHLRNYWKAVPRVSAAEVAWMALFGQSAASMLGTVLSRASTVVQVNIAAARWLEDPAECLIKPAADDVGVFDFDRAADTIEAGRMAARSILPQLRAQIDARRAQKASAFAARLARSAHTSLGRREAA